MDVQESLAAVNATLNLSAGVLLVLGRRAVARSDVARHRRLMLGAFGVSCAFLVSYVTRLALAGGPKPFPDLGWVRTLYLVVLGTHSLLAAVVPFLVLRTLFLAWKARIDAHRRIARWTYPVWLYVSATGVIVYLMYYQLAPRLAAAAN